MYIYIYIYPQEPTFAVGLLYKEVSSSVAKVRGERGLGGGGVIASVPSRNGGRSSVAEYLLRASKRPFLRRKPVSPLQCERHVFGGRGVGVGGVIAHTARLAVCQQTSYRRKLSSCLTRSSPSGS